MNWQVIVSSSKIFSLKQAIKCFKHKVIPVKAHVLSQENELVNITWAAHVSLFLLTRFPARLNTLSEGTDEAGMARYFLARRRRCGKTAGCSSTTVEASALGPQG